MCTTNSDAENRPMKIMLLTAIAARVRITQVVLLVAQTDSRKLKQNHVGMDTIGVMQTAADHTPVKSRLLV